MIKTNSKKFREKVKSYLFGNLFDDSGYELMEFKKENYKNDKEKALLILEVFCKEMRQNELTFEVFESWAAGLPAIVDTADYYCHNSAIGILDNFLEETEERNRYDEIQAEKLLTYVIYRELESELKK